MVMGFSPLVSSTGTTSIIIISFGVSSFQRLHCRGRWGTHYFRIPVSCSPFSYMSHPLTFPSLLNIGKGSVLIIEAPWRIYASVMCPSLVRMVACRRVGAKPLFVPMWNNINWTLGTNFSEILIEIDTFSVRKMHLKMSSGKWRPFCLGLNVFNELICYIS